MTNRIAWFIFGVLLLAFCGVALFQIGSAEVPYVGHDVGNTLLYAEGMIRGDRLYADMFNANPPTIFFFAVLAMKLATFVGISPIPVYFILVVAIFGVAITVINATMKTRPARWGVTFSLLLLLAAPPAGWDFGQREHLFVLLLLPALIGGLYATGHYRLEILLGFLLGFFGMMKPHMWFMGVIAQIMPLRRRPLRQSLPRLTAFVGGTLAPFAALYWWSPDSFRAYFNDVIPYLQSGAYSSYNTIAPLEFTLSMHGLLSIAGALAACAATFLAGHRLDHSARLTLCLTQLIAFASVYIQGKFWSYHLLLNDCVAAGIISYIVALVAPRLAAWLCATLAAVSLYAFFGQPHALSAADLAVRQCLARSGRVMFVTTYIADLLTRMQLAGGVSLVDPWDHNIKLSGALSLRTADGPTAVLAAEADIAARIAQTKPDLVVIGGFIARNPHFFLGVLTPPSQYELVTDKEQCAKPVAPGALTYVRRKP